jgi:aryl-alcohol dehydrogenase-like predicted oxidoreductase
MMEYRLLGRSGLKVSGLCLGTMVFGDESARGASVKESIRMVHRFLDAGGNHIDTANVYAGGRSEEILGEALKGRREQAVLATKVRFTMGEGPNEEGLSRSNILRAVEASLKRLQTEYVDLLYMHCWDPLTPLGESLRAFEDLVTAGKVRYIGVSNFKAWQVMKALAISSQRGWARYVAGQYQYSLIVRDIEREYIDLFQDEGIGLVPWGPLGGGFLSGKYTRSEKKPSEGRLAMMPDETEEAWHRRNIERNWAIIDCVDEIAGAQGWTHAQVALAWLLNQPTVSSVVIGVRTMTQLEDNLRGIEIQLAAEQVENLNRVSAFELGYPYRFMKVYGGRR